ncbi:hypothetical protein G6F40_015800 [Rhizopus arrhizus]|nr:hypothetical protein G6F40_015800 [Rhizopus arrhizus]
MMRETNLLAQGAIGQVGQRRLAGGVEQGDHVLAFQATGLGGFGGGSDLLLGQAGQLLDGVDGDRRSVHFRLHVLAELGAQVGQLGVHLLQRGLVGLGQLGAGAHVVVVVLLDQAHAFVVQAQLAAARSHRCARRTWPSSRPAASCGCRWCRHRPG